MDSLIAVGSGAALVYGAAALFIMAYASGHGHWETVEHYRENLYFESAAMILTLVTLGKFLESRAKGKTGDAIAALLDLRPKTATVLRDGNEIAVPADEVKIGEIVVVLLIEDGNKLLVVVKDVAAGLGIPVDVDLIGVAIAVLEILACGNLGALLCKAVGHDNHASDVVPVKPGREDCLAIIDSVRNDSINFDDVVGQFGAGLFDKINAICRQLLD